MTDVKDGDKVHMTVDEFAAVLQKEIDEFTARWKYGVENELEFHSETMDLKSWYAHWDSWYDS